MKRTWNISTANSSEPHRVQAEGLALTGNGDLLVIGSDGNPERFYAKGHWLEAVPSSIQGAVN